MEDEPVASLGPLALSSQKWGWTRLRPPAQTPQREQQKPVLGGGGLSRWLTLRPECQR